VDANFSAPVQIGPGAHPTSYTMCIGSQQGVMRPGRGFDHLLASSAEVKGRVKLYLYFLSGPSWLVLGQILPLMHYYYYRYYHHHHHHLLYAGYLYLYSSDKLCP